MGRLACTVSCNVASKMTHQYGAIQIGLGLGVMLLAFLFWLRADRTQFRWLFLVGLMGLAGGIMASGFIDFWFGFSLFLLWFVVAGYFYFQERQERSNTPH